MRKIYLHRWGRFTCKETLHSPSKRHYIPILLGLHFKPKRIGIIADIEKASFCKLGYKTKTEILPDLWIKDVKTKEINNSSEIYRFTKIPFGIISITFLLENTIHIIHHLEESNSAIALKIKDDIYLDEQIANKMQ